MLKFTLLVKPVTKKNHTRNFITKTGKQIVLPSKQYAEFEKEVVKQIKRLGISEVIQEPINLKAMFYRDRNYKSDLVGYEQALCDALVKAKILEDDHCGIVRSMDGSKVLTDKLNPRIEVEITKYDND